jgi:phytoene desaturase
VARVVVVGGGVGGLVAAIRLQAAGHHVTLFERNQTVGGKLATEVRDGYGFDLGPSLLTWPEVFDDVFRVAGTTLADHLDLVRLDPQFAYRWTDGSVLTVPDGDAARTTAFEEFAPGAGGQWRRFDDRGRRIWDVTTRTFFAGPISSPVALARRLRSPFDLTAIDPFRTLHRSAVAHFDDVRLVQWADRYATYSGSSPFKAPATLACIPHLEARHGCWYPMGGLDRLRTSLAEVAAAIGVDVVTGVDVTSIEADDRVTAVVTADGAREPTDVVVANTDAEHLYRDLLPDPGMLRAVRRAQRSTSGFVLCAGVRGLTPSLAHHNVWFSNDYATEYDALGAGRLADDPTIYACVSSVTDPSQAPDGCENWFLLVNTPSGVEVDAESYGDVVLDRLAGHGVDLRPRIETRFTMTPADIERRYRAPGGAIYGTSSNGMRAAFTRPANRGSKPGLYLVGGSSHPGGGLPLVAVSAKIVTDMVVADLDQR